MRTSGDALRSIKRYTAHALGPAWEVRLWEEDGTFKRPFARVARAGQVLPRSHGRSAIDLTMPVAVHLYANEAEQIEDAFANAEAGEERFLDGIKVGVAYVEALEPPQVEVVQVPGTGGMAGDWVYAVTARTADGESLPSGPLPITVVGSSHVMIQWSPVGEALSYRVYRGTDSDDLGLLGTYSVPAADAEAAYMSLALLDDGTLIPGASPPSTATALLTRRGAPDRIPLYDHADVPWRGADSDTTARFEHDYLRVVDLSFNRLHDPVDERLISTVADLRVTWRRRGRVSSWTNLVNAVRVTEFHD